MDISEQLPILLKVEWDNDKIKLRLDEKAWDILKNPTILFERFL